MVDERIKTAFEAASKALVDGDDVAFSVAMEEVRKERWYADERTCRHGHPFSRRNTYWNGGKAFCRTCQSKRSVSWQRAKRAAIATEAQRAATVEQGAVHEGAGPQDIAQSPSQ